MYKCDKCGNAKLFIEENTVFTAIQLSDNGKINNMKDTRTVPVKTICAVCNEEVFKEVIKTIK